jgi:hypothetical protein
MRWPVVRLFGSCLLAAAGALAAAEYRIELDVARPDLMVDRMHTSDQGAPWHALITACNRSGVLPIVDQSRWTGLTVRDLASCLEAGVLRWSAAGLTGRFRPRTAVDTDRWWGALGAAGAAADGAAIVVAGRTWRREGGEVALGPVDGPVLPPAPAPAEPALTLTIAAGALPAVTLRIEVPADHIAAAGIPVDPAIPVLDQRLFTRLPAEVRILAAVAVATDDSRSRLTALLELVGIAAPGWLAEFPPTIQGTVLLVVTGTGEMPIITLALPVGAGIDAWCPRLVGLETVPVGVYLPLLAGDEFWLLVRGTTHWFLTQDPMLVDRLTGTGVAADLALVPVVEPPPADAVAIVRAQGGDLLRLLIDRFVRAGSGSDFLTSDLLRRHLRDFALARTRVPAIRLDVRREAAGLSVTGEGVVLPLLATLAMARQAERGRELQERQRLTRQLRAAWQSLSNLPGGLPDPAARPPFPGEARPGDSPIIFLRPPTEGHEAWMPLLVLPLPGGAESTRALLLFSDGACALDDTGLILPEARRIAVQQDAGREAEAPWQAVRHRLGELRAVAEAVGASAPGGEEGFPDL